MGGDGQAIVQRRLKSLLCAYRSQKYSEVLEDNHEGSVPGSEARRDGYRARAERMEALQLVISLLAEDADWVEHGLASPRSASQFRGTGTNGRAGMATKGTPADAWVVS